jgi:hypothetical protein
MTSTPRLTTTSRGRFRIAALIIGLLLVMVVVDSFLSAPPTATGDLSSARALLLAYYDAINRRDYGAAYAMWAAPSGGYQDFAEGFADTASVTAHIGDFQQNGTASEAGPRPTARSVAARLVGRVPVVVVARRVNGEHVSFYGCFWVRDVGEASPRWVIDTAMILELALPSPDAATIERILTTNCYKDTPATS